MKDKDIQIIEKINIYCVETKETIKRFGDNYDIFLADKDYFKSVSMSLMQIGELSNNLSNAFRESQSPIVWKKAYGLRNIFAHHYGKIDKEIIWEIITVDMPDLHELCKSIISAYNQN